MVNDIVETLRIDLSKYKGQSYVYLRRNDTRTRRLVISITKDGQLVSLERVVAAMLAIKKADGSETLNSMIRQGNTLCYTIRTEDCNVVGDAEAQVIIAYKDGRKFTTPAFTLSVFDDILVGNPEATENTYTALTDLVASCQTLADEAADSVEDAREYADLAQASAEQASTLCSQTTEMVVEVNIGITETKNIANAAKSIAEGIDAKAEEARDTAIEAASNIEEALETASEAEEKASNALAHVNGKATVIILEDEDELDGFDDTIYDLGTYHVGDILHVADGSCPDYWITAENLYPTGGCYYSIRMWKAESQSTSMAAESVTLDNSSLVTLESDNVQDVVEEIDSAIETLNGELGTLDENMGGLKFSVIDGILNIAYDDGEE